MRNKLTKQGKLYIVSTPIGNLKDISLRALEILENVHLIAAEDTRQTRKLLSHYKIKTPLLSYFDYNKIARADVLIKKLKHGRDIALVCNAGTPCISDPGFYLVTLAIKEGICVVPIPGTSALLAALVVSGAAPDRFVFEGYLPRKSKKRENRLREIACRLVPSPEQKTAIFNTSCLIAAIKNDYADTSSLQSPFLLR